MSAGLGQLISLTRLTASEALRQPVCLLLMATSVVMTTLVPLLALHNLAGEGRLARDGGLAFHLLFGLLVTGYAASAALSGEVRRGTAAAVLAKPVGRSLFFLAKYLGVAVAVLCFSAISTMATLAAERIAEKFYQTPDMVGYALDWKLARLVLLSLPIGFLGAGVANYTRNRPFQSSAFLATLVLLCASLLVAGCFNQAGHGAPYDLRLSATTAVAGALVTMALLVLAAIALTLSTRFSTAPTLVLSLAILLAGLGSTHWFGPQPGRPVIAGVLGTVIPNWQHFWMVDHLSNANRIPARLVAGAAVYGLCYTAAMLCIGAAAFRHSEVSSR